MDDKEFLSLKNVLHRKIIEVNKLQEKYMQETGQRYVIAGLEPVLHEDESVEAAWQKVVKCTPFVEDLFDRIELAIKDGDLRLLKPESHPEYQETDYVDQLREITKTIGFLMHDLGIAGRELKYKEKEEN